MFIGLLLLFLFVYELLAELNRTGYGVIIRFCLFLLLFCCFCYMGALSKLIVPSSKFQVQS